MTQILSAVENAHAHDIVIVIWNQNILVDEAGNVKISDFGIAIALSETAMTQTNTLLDQCIIYHQSKHGVQWQRNVQTSIHSELFCMKC